MHHPYFFGYGSLVNVQTHTYDNFAKATLCGWRRAWRHTPFRDLAFLTAVPDDTCEILGLIAAVPNADWAALDEREFAYERVSVSHQIDHKLECDLDIAVYAVEASQQAAPSIENPILLSYLDVVVQGYLQQFGQEGAAHFAQTTTGWDAPIINDRAAPLYPRSQSLTHDELRQVDRLIEDVGATLRVAPDRLNRCL